MFHRICKKSRYFKAILNAVHRCLYVRMLQSPHSLDGYRPVSPLNARSRGSGQRILRRGGFNNRADRISWELSRSQCERLIDATHLAFQLGRPFNRFITLAWGKCEIDRELCVMAMGRWIALLRDWLRSQGFCHSWAWVQEWGPSFGAHCHALLHIPPTLDHLFKPMPRKWMVQVLKREGLFYVAGGVETQRLHPLYLPDQALPACHPARQIECDHDLAYKGYLTSVLEKVHYMLKCAPAELEHPLGLAGAGFKEWGQTCAVFGKRLATWQFKAERPRTGGTRS